MNRRQFLSLPAVIALVSVAVAVVPAKTIRITHEGIVDAINRNPWAHGYIFSRAPSRVVKIGDKIYIGKDFGWCQLISRDFDSQIWTMKQTRAPL